MRGNCTKSMIKRQPNNDPRCHCLPCSHESLSNNMVILAALECFVHITGAGGETEILLLASVQEHGICFVKRVLTSLFKHSALVSPKVSGKGSTWKKY